AAGHEPPAPDHVEDVRILPGRWQGRVGLGQARDPQGRLVQQPDPAGLDDGGALHAAVAADADVDHHGAADPAAPGLVGIVEVADPLDPVHPGAQVAGPGVLAGARRHVLAGRALRVELAGEVDLGRQPGHAQVALDLQLAGRQRLDFGLVQLARGRRRLVAGAAGHYPRLLPRARRRGLGAQLARGHAGLRLGQVAGLAVAGALRLVVFAAALVAGLGE